MTDTMRINVLAGSHIKDAFQRVVEEATKHGAVVKCDFNGVDIVATPGEGLSSVESIYNAKRENLRQEAKRRQSQKTLDRLVEAVILTINQPDWTHQQLREALNEVVHPQ